MSTLVLQTPSGQASASLGVERRRKVSKVTGPRSAGPNRLHTRAGPAMRNPARLAAARSSRPTASHGFNLSAPLRRAAMHERAHDHALGQDEDQQQHADDNPRPGAGEAPVEIDDGRD